MTGYQADELIKQLKAINEQLGRIAEALAKPQRGFIMVLTIPHTSLDEGFPEGLEKAIEKALVSDFTDDAPQ